MSENERQEWLDSLQEGDEVAIPFKSTGVQCWHITTVSKITPTRRIRVDEGKREYSNKGEERRRDLGYSQIVPVMDHMREMMRRRRLVGFLSNTRFSDYTTECLEKLVGLIAQEKEQNNNDRT